MGESWDEELRQNLYDCLCRCNDFAFEKKSLDVPIPNEILNFIQTITLQFVNQDANKGSYLYFKIFSYVNLLIVFIICITIPKTLSLYFRRFSVYNRCLNYVVLLVPFLVFFRPRT